MNAKLVALLAAVATALPAHSDPPRFGGFGSAVVSPPDGLMVINGSLYKVQKGLAMAVVGSGLVRGVDGNPVRIPNGAMYTTDGQLIPIPPGISVSGNFNTRFNNTRSDANPSGGLRFQHPGTVSSFRGRR